MVTNPEIFDFFMILINKWFHNSKQMSCFLPSKNRVLLILFANKGSVDKLGQNLEGGNFRFWSEIAHVQWFRKGTRRSKQTDSGTHRTALITKSHFRRSSWFPSWNSKKDGISKTIYSSSRLLLHIQKGEKLSTHGVMEHTTRWYSHTVLGA